MRGFRYTIVYLLNYCPSRERYSSHKILLRQAVHACSNVHAAADAQPDWHARAHADSQPDRHCGAHIHASTDVHALSDIHTASGANLHTRTDLYPYTGPDLHAATDLHTLPYCQAVPNGDTVSHT